MRLDKTQDNHALNRGSNFACKIWSGANNKILKVTLLVSRKGGGINRLFAYCKGGNFNIHIWALFGSFIGQVLFII